MTDIVRRLRERQADMAETIERLDTSEFDTGAMGQIRAELHDLYREAADEIDRLTRERDEARVARDAPQPERQPVSEPTEAQIEAAARRMCQMKADAIPSVTFDYLWQCAKNGFIEEAREVLCAALAAKESTENNDAAL